MTKITLAGRDFTVERLDSKHTAYLLTGVRGAVYGAVRFQLTASRDRFFLVKLTGKMTTDPLGPIVLTDVTGTLEEVR